MKCRYCNAELPGRGAFCPACGAKIEAPAPQKTDSAVPAGYPAEDSKGQSGYKTPVIQEGAEDRTTWVRPAAPEKPATPVWADEPVNYPPYPYDNPEQIPEEKPEKKKSKRKMNIVPLVLLLVAIAMWALLPFMAVNIATLGDQPTALALLMDDVDYIGDLAESMAYWIAIVAAAGLLLCLICVLCKSRILSRLIAALTTAIFAITVVDVLKWAGDWEDFFAFFGLAFWGAAVALLVVLLLGGGRRRRG